MSRKVEYGVVAMSWILGLAFLAGVGWVLDRFLSPGPVKTVLNFLLIGLALTLFGVLPRDLRRRTRLPNGKDVR
jgi:F0F1-type ATP synthase assembly protein I